MLHLQLKSIAADNVSIGSTEYSLSGLTCSSSLQHYKASKHNATVQQQKPVRATGSCAIWYRGLECAFFGVMFGITFVVF